VQTAGRGRTALPENARPHNKAGSAAIEFRGLPPAARDELKANLGDGLAVQESEWDCGSFVEANHKRKPFDDVR
jgi:peptide/nickel transport system substrate-binding protein